MNRFENVDIIASLDAIMWQNTSSYQSDFEIDKKIIQRAATSPVDEDRRLLWMSCPSKTYCFRERNVLLRDTGEYNTWNFYGEQTNKNILAYAVKIISTEDGTIKGDLYELNYQEHFKHIIERALPADTVTLYYEHGERKQPAKKHFDSDPDLKLGKLEYLETLPNNPDALDYLLKEEQRKREQMKLGDFKKHIAALRDSRIKLEAERILSELQALKEPNSPQKTHFMVELSPYFTKLASSRDTDCLLSMLPFKKLFLSNLKDRHGIYAFLSKDENRNKGLRKTVCKSRTKD